MATKLSVFKNGGVHIFGKPTKRFSASAKIGKSVSVGTAKYTNGIKHAKSQGLKPVKLGKGSYSRLPKV
jgi:hypothetical protein